MELYNRYMRAEIITGGEKKIIEDEPALKQHMEFKATLTRKSKPNKGEIVFLNLSPETRKLFEGLDDDDAVEVYAGYGGNADNARKIFSGNIFGVSDKMRDRTTNALTLQLQDGYKGYKRAYISKSFAEGTNVKQVFKDMASSLELPIIFETTILDSLQLGRAYTAEGKTRKELDVFADAFDLDWSIQYGNVHVFERDGEKLKDKTVVLLTPDSGLVGSPVDKTKESRKRKKRKEIEYTTLFNEGLSVGGLVKIESRNISGVFINDYLKYDLGNYSGTKFYCIGGAHG